MTEETLVLAAKAEDNFSATLGELKQDLYDIGRLEEQVFDIDTGVDDVAETIGELEAIDDAVESIDDDVDIDVDADADALDKQFDTGGTPFTEEEAFGVADFVSPFTSGAPGVTDDPRAGADGGATADGGSDDSSFLDPDNQRELVNRLSDTFDTSFDESRMFRRGGITDVDMAIQGGIGEFVDTRQLVEAFGRGDVDMDLIKALAGGDPLDQLDALDEVADMGMADTPFPGDESRFQGVIRRFSELELKMGDFFKVFASLLPLLINFVAALPAAIGGLIGLAGAAVGAAGGLAAIAGLGILGLGLEDGQFSFDRVTDRVSELRDAFIDSFGGLAERFEPLIQDAFGGVERLFDDLAAQGSALLQLRDDARAFGGFMLDVIPRVVGSFAALGDAAAPVLGMIGQFFANTDFAAIFADLLAQTLPLLVRFTTAALELLPVVFQLSLGFFQVATFIIQFAAVIGTLLDSMGPLLPVLGFLVGTMLTLVTLTATASLVSNGFSAALNILGFSMDLTSASATSLTNALTTLTGSAATATAAVNVLGAALRVVIPVAGIVLLASQFASMSQSISNATDQLKEFRDTARRTDGVGIGAGVGGGGAGRTDAFTSVTNMNFNIDASSPTQANRSTQATRFGATEESVAVYEGSTP